MAFIIVSAIGLVAADGAGGGRLQSDPYISRAHVATWNIYGGNGNAVTRFNDSVAAYNSSNSVQSRIIARGVHLQGVALQEVCEAQYNTIVWELTAKGLTAGVSGYRTKFVNSLNSALGTAAPSADCGSWFGNAVIFRGDFTAPAGDRYAATYQQSDIYNELRSWVCAGNTRALCSTHLDVGASYAVQQSSFYRSVGGLYSAGYGLTTFMAGDFNLEPGYETLAWVGGGWLDPDQYSGGMQDTTDSGLVIDYIWKSNPSSWWTDAFVGPNSRSDHHWKQGYY